MYARTSLVFAVIPFALYAAELVVVVAASWGVGLIPPFGDMSARAYAITLLCSMASVCLAIETAVKYRWPGSTAHAQASKPQRRDLMVAVVAIVLTACSLSAFVTQLFFAV